MLREDPDLLRILNPTDNHLGVGGIRFARMTRSCLPRDIRIAKQQNVDAVFLGGDRDVNKPRETMVRTMEILQEYCVNDRPVQLEVLGDQTVGTVEPRAVPSFGCQQPIFPPEIPFLPLTSLPPQPAGGRGKLRGRT